MRPAFDDLHPSFAQQPADPAREAVDDAVLPSHSLRDVEAGRLHPDAQRRTARLVLCPLELMRGVNQRLRRNAADGQASAAEALALYQYGRNAQLPGADGGHITAGAAADDE